MRTEFVAKPQSPLRNEGSSSRQPIKKCSHRCLQKPIKNQSPRVLPLGLSGAATRIRTGDLILTKDVLYQLSHSSIPQGVFLVTLDNYSKKKRICQYLLQKIIIFFIIKGKFSISMGLKCKKSDFINQLTSFSEKSLDKFYIIC